MRSLLCALAAAGLVIFTLSGYAADEPYTGQSKAEKPGRAIGQDVKTGDHPDKPGRAIGQDVKTGGNPEKPGRAIGQDVTTGGKPEKPGRAVGEDKTSEKATAPSAPAASEQAPAGAKPTTPAKASKKNHKKKPPAETKG
jgi:hypothetical protein